MNVHELSEITHTPIEVRSGYNGKVLCKAYKAKNHTDIAMREVTEVWSEIRVSSGGGYTSFAKPVICVFVNGYAEYLNSRKDGQNDERD